MKIETLKDRIKKAEAKIIKINGTLEKHNKQLTKKATVLTKQGIDLKNYDRYNYRQTQTYWDICDYEDKLESITSNKKKLAETTSSLNKYKEQLKNQLAKDKKLANIIPPVLDEFLNNWRTKCYDFYIKLANEYIEEKYNKEYNITKENLQLLQKRQRIENTWNYKLVRKYTDEQIEKILSTDLDTWEKEKLQHLIKNHYWKKFIKNHFASDIAIIEKIVNYKTIDKIVLNKILDDDVKVKRENFIIRIKEVIGDIKDLSKLDIDARGELNGIAEGVKANAKIQTITAGGYNIQCFHFRVLVNTIK